MRIENGAMSWKLGAKSTKPSFWPRCFAPLDSSSLVCFRIAVGTLMLWEVHRYFAHGWIDRYFIAPHFHFSYYGFGWVQPWPGNGMYFHFLGLGLLSICIVLGLWYRLSTALFFLGFTYVFLIEQARYLNHFYLLCWISFLLMCIPAHRTCSLDAWRRPEFRSATVPAWTLWLLRAQLGLVYFYGGIAKLNSDWLQGEPMRTWLTERFPDLAQASVAYRESVVYFFSYGGLLFDLSVTPLLLWKKTRYVAFGAALTFNLTNAWLFRIGVFPWFMLAATTLFFPPDWPRRFNRTLRLVSSPQRAVPYESWQENSLLPQRKVTLALIGLYLFVQTLVPLRHLLYPGNVSWTEEGHRFAWRMKLRDKEASIQFTVTDATNGKVRSVNPEDYLAPFQLAEMANRPDMILQFSHYLAEEISKQGFDQIRVYANVMVSLNGREPQLLVDPTVDLASQPRTLQPASWIVPLTEPLPQVVANNNG